MTFYVSQSKVSDWQLCRRKYHFRWVEHLKPRVPPRPLKFGSITHELLEANARDIDMMTALQDIADRERRLIERERETYGPLLDDMGYIMRAYKHYYGREPLRFKQIDKVDNAFKITKIPAIEVQFETELTEDISVKGKIDGIVEAKGAEWILEHKTHKDFPNADHRWRNIQSAVYLRVSEMLGWARPAGMLWDYIRSKSPARPRLLVSGKLSTAECDTLPEVARDAVNEYLAQPAYVLDRAQIAQAAASLIEAQTKNLPTWFQRVFTPVQPRVVESLFADFVATAGEMLDYYRHRPDEPPRKSIGLHCSWCQFEPLCRAELQDNDIEFIRRASFVVDTSEYQTEVVE